MCGTKKSDDLNADAVSKASSHNEDLEKYVESFDKIISNIGSLTNAIVGVSLDASREINDKAKRWSETWFSKSRNDRDYGYDYDELAEGSKDSVAFPPFYETRDAGNNNCFPKDIVPPILQDFWKNNLFWQGEPLKLSSFPFGYRAYKGPSIRQYHDCLDKQGKSIWDEKGYWRCLFPASEFSTRLLDFKKNYLQDSIITKEDFFEKMKQVGETEDKPIIDLQDQGKFFNKYEDYLGWKRNQYVEKEKKEKEKEKEQEKKALLQLKNAGLDTQDRYLTSNSVSSKLFTDEDTNEVKLLETRKQCFSDGNCTLTKITKSKPIGSAQWVSEEEHTEDIRGENDGKGNKGWFWK
ncbi:hypothetical protein KGF56_002377 [Candida oxycetoniae]|uniref:Mitochondrial peculiar membrane protein 1 n=1 Tax=Candida oxycetoniae TaxID=497107 RepID=A0AAI9SY36_9ASCO|nr:uncharacterized protein KGF56_002377 [Candida oxycetoniae]KAI3404860.2 hypothetical protein KGF56_002377 [Candida oxycetoniae]